MKGILSWNWINYLFSSSTDHHQAHIINMKPVYKKPSTSASKEYETFGKYCTVHAVIFYLFASTINNGKTRNFLKTFRNKKARDLKNT